MSLGEASEIPPIPASLQSPSTGGVVGSLLLETAILNDETKPRYEMAIGMLTELVQFWNPAVASSEVSFGLVNAEIKQSGPAGAILLPLELITEGAALMERPEVAAVALTALSEVNPAAATKLCSDFNLAGSVQQFPPELQSGSGIVATIGATREYLLDLPPLRTEPGDLPSRLGDALEGVGSALDAHSNVAIESSGPSGPASGPDSMQCRLTCHDEATNTSTWTEVRETVSNFAKDIWKLGQPDPEDSNDVDVTPIEVLIDAGKKAGEKADEEYEERYKACVQTNCETEPEPQPSPTPNTDDEPEVPPLSVDEPIDNPNSTLLPPEDRCNPAIMDCPDTCDPSVTDCPQLLPCVIASDDPMCGEQPPKARE
jgi:hypothetical protein